MGYGFGEENHRLNPPSHHILSRVRTINSALAMATLVTGLSPLCSRTLSPLSMLPSLGGHHAPTLRAPPLERAVPAGGIGSSLGGVCAQSPASASLPSHLSLSAQTQNLFPTSGYHPIQLAAQIAPALATETSSGWFLSPYARPSPFCVFFSGGEHLLIFCCILYTPCLSLWSSQLSKAGVPSIGECVRKQGPGAGGAHGYLDVAASRISQLLEL